VERTDPVLQVPMQAIGLSTILERRSAPQRQIFPGSFPPSKRSIPSPSDQEVSPKSERASAECLVEAWWLNVFPSVHMRFFRSWRPARRARNGANIHRLLRQTYRIGPGHPQSIQTLEIHRDGYPHSAGIVKHQLAQIPLKISPGWFRHGQATNSPSGVVPLYFGTSTDAPCRWMWLYAIVPLPLRKHQRIPCTRLDLEKVASGTGRSRRVRRPREDWTCRHNLGYHSLFEGYAIANDQVRVSSACLISAH